jgi:hypothetical protein
MAGRNSSIKGDIEMTLPSVAIWREPPPRVYRTCTETFLSDRQQALLDGFMRRYVRSQRRQHLFLVLVFSLLGAASRAMARSRSRSVRPRWRSE